MRFGTLRRALAAGLVAIVLASFGAARADDEPKTYGEGSDGLKSLWTDVLAKATAGDEKGVEDMLAKLLMTEADFTSVFPEDKGKDLFAKYNDKFVKLWPKESKTLVAKTKEKGYDEVEVVEHIASKDGAGGDKTDKKVLTMLNEGTKMYLVRVKKKGDKTGLRYESFFYVNGAWKTGLKLTKLVGGDEKPKKAAGEKKDAPKPADPAKPTDTPKPTDPPKEGEKPAEGEKKDGGDGE